MFLMFRYRLGYETLCREVADLITWRRFCRIPLDGQVPHPTTRWLTTRCRPAAVYGCNQALLANAAQAKLLRPPRAVELAVARRHMTNATRRLMAQGDRLIEYAPPAPPGTPTPPSAPRS